MALHAVSARKRCQPNGSWVVQPVYLTSVHWILFAWHKILVSNIQAIAWIPGLFQPAFNSKACRHLPLPLLSFSFPQALLSDGCFIPSFSLLPFFFLLFFPLRDTNVHRMISSKTPLPTEIWDLQGAAILQQRLLLMLQLLCHINLSWPRDNVYETSQDYILVHRRSQPQPLGKRTCEGVMGVSTPGHVCQLLAAPFVHGEEQVRWPVGQSVHQPPG